MTIKAQQIKDSAAIDWVDDTLTIRPYRFSIMLGVTNFANTYIASTLTVNVSCHCASVLCPCAA